jgi:hypothetical protein
MLPESQCYHFSLLNPALATNSEFFIEKIINKFMLNRLNSRPISSSLKQCLMLILSLSVSGSLAYCINSIVYETNQRMLTRMSLRWRIWGQPQVQFFAAGGDPMTGVFAFCHQGAPATLLSSNHYKVPGAQPTVSQVSEKGINTDWDAFREKLLQNKSRKTEVLRSKFRSSNLEYCLVFVMTIITCLTFELTKANPWWNKH